MPFTPAHAVVALPFLRTPLLPAAMAIGAMAPDLPLFVRGTAISYQATHTNVVLSTMLAMALVALWYLVLRPAVRELTPRPIAARLPGEWDATGSAAWSAVRASRPGAERPLWGRPLVWGISVTVSLLLGVLSHIAWDAFSHEGRWGLSVFPSLAQQWGPLAGYKWVQYGSGVGGLLLLAVFGGVWLRRRPTSDVRRVLPDAVRALWWISLPLILVVAWVWGSITFGAFTSEWTPQHLAYRVLPPACAVWAVLTLALAVGILIVRRTAVRNGDGASGAVM
ncbi:DUF4184 family protein [uncultured Microbacterium sp.]|uniref:DUF4184 family protein n=1 Tax=uncultured Microbacterium sp. TaxID=191216 RepID=UPI002636A02D|nr:DUF4184 family protein [uncultured Microbacterium sp.]